MDLANRNDLEALLAKKLGKLQQGQYKQLLTALGDPPRLENLSPDYFQRMADELQGVIQPVLEDIYTQQTVALMGLDKVKAVAVDWNLINQRAAEWARKYSGTLCKNVSDSTRDAIRQQLEGFYRDARTMGDLEASLGRLFSPIRAEMIAITEVTRASAQGELAFAEELRRLGLKTTFVWQTSQDDIVCPICGPLNEKEQGQGWSDPPPAHPRCRCFINTKVIASD